MTTSTRSFTTLLIVLTLAAMIAPHHLVYASRTVPMSIPEFEKITCNTIYFLNAIYVKNSTLNTTIYLETPQNLSLGNTLNQTSITLYVKNLNFSKEHKYYAFNITPGHEFYGFFLSKVVICGPDRTRLRHIIDTIIKNLRYKYYHRTRNETIPSDIASKYLLNPHEIIIKVLRPEFEAWLKTMFNVSAKNLSKLALTVAAAYYIYGQFYITYSPSPFPRSVDDVVKEKKGDCDDMSRVLVDLLRSYGIPALIAYGYVVIESKWLEHYVIPVENTTYIFHYAGPHAFTIAYIPGLGWMPIDLLAGSMIVYPFIFENFSANTDVNKTAVEEFKNMSKKLIAIQLIAALDENEYKKILNYSGNPIDAISLYINKTMGLINATAATMTTTTTTTQTQKAITTTLSKSTTTSTTQATSKNTITTTITTQLTTLITEYTTTQSATTRITATSSILSMPSIGSTSTSLYTSSSTLQTLSQLVNATSTTRYTTSIHTTAPITTSSLTSINQRTETTHTTSTQTRTQTYLSPSLTRTEGSSTFAQPKTSAAVLVPAIAIIIVIALAAVILRKAL